MVSKLIKIDSADDISIIKETDIGYGLEELSFLKDGWYDGEGISLDIKSLNWLSDALDNNLILHDIETYVFPTLDGNTQFEWSSKNWEVSLKINLHNKEGELHKVNLNDDSDFEVKLDLNTDEAWVHLNEEIQSTIIPQ